MALLIKKSIKMKIFMVLVVGGLWLFSGLHIKECSSDHLNSSDLCSFRKSKHVCLCSYQSDVNTHFPALRADCSRMNMEQFPIDTYLPNVEDLDLSHNLISYLDPYTVNFKSSKVRSIKLSFNRIHYIVQDFFQNMPNLLELDLSNNELAAFPNSNTFRGLKNLKILNLSFNELSTIPEGFFSILPNLQELNLQQNYLGVLMMNTECLFNYRLGLSPNVTTLKLDGLGIYNLNYTFFDGALNLKHLSLAYNPLREIPAVPYSLDFLDLSGIDITTLSAKYLNYHSLKVLKLNKLQKLENIEHYAFYNLQALEELELNDCKNLREFNDLAFGIIENESEWSLQKISLARSGLRSLNSTYLHLFNKSVHVDLQSNPWVCNCDILWFQELNESLYNRESLR